MEQIKRTNIFRFYGMLIVIASWVSQPCKASSFFEMTLEHDSIYTPGSMSLSLGLTDKAKIEDDYRFQVSVYVSDTLMRKQVFSASKTEPVTFELSFPKAHDKTSVRCRTELFINSQFVEAKEKPLILWPPLTFNVEKLKDKVIWVFDISGQLQKIFKDLGGEVIDATFQAVRSFGTPDIVFIGQGLDPNSMQVITDRLRLVDSKPVVIFLKQKRLLESLDIEIPKVNNRPESIVCDPDSFLLQGLNEFDIMNLVDKAVYIKVRRQRDKDRFVNSYVTEVTKEKEDEVNIYSYLLMVEDKNQTTVYCQISLFDGNDPRYDILFNNLLNFANKVRDSQQKVHIYNERNNYENFMVSINRCGSFVPAGLFRY